MLLDKGICSIFRKKDISPAGGKPRDGYERIYQSWYGELSFETAPFQATGARTDVKTAARIRIHQNRAIGPHDVLVLLEVPEMPETARRMDVTRAFHGTDEENGQPITDLTLAEVEA